MKHTRNTRTFAALLLAQALLFITSNALAHDSRDHRHDSRHYDEFSDRHAKHNYYYYPEHGIYFDTDRGIYIYLDAGRWLTSRILPWHITLFPNERVKISVNSNRPYDYHDRHQRKYPKHMFRDRKHKKKHAREHRKEHRRDHARDDRREHRRDHAKDRKEHRRDHARDDRREHRRDHARDDRREHRRDYTQSRERSDYSADKRHSHSPGVTATIIAPKVPVPVVPGVDVKIDIKKELKKLKDPKEVLETLLKPL